jgi:hypothetical protein
MGGHGNMWMTFTLSLVMIQEINITLAISMDGVNPYEHMHAMQIMWSIIVYWISIRLEMILHKHIDIQPSIWTILGVRWSHILLALPFIAFLLFIGSYKQYGMTLIPLRIIIVALFFLMPLSLYYLYWLRAI